jgi:ABC-2 type transport system ATP-binding protein
MLDLSAHKDREVRLLSRGMQQKVAIANALIHDPEILVLDEPTLGLDVEAAKTLEETIVRLAKKGRAILLTTHVMSLAQRLAHHIFVIHEGQQVAYENTKTLLNQFDTRNIVEVKLKEPLTLETWQQVSQGFPSLVNHGQMLEWVEPEQAQIVALHQMLHQQAATVLSINRREPALEEVFLSLTRRAKQANGTHA